MKSDSNSAKIDSSTHKQKTTFSDQILAGKKIFYYKNS